MSYTLGPARWRTLPRVRTKPQHVERETWSGGTPSVSLNTGGGYEQIRSYEERPHTVTDGKEDVYVYLHRLCAVAWCYDSETPTSDVLEDLAGSDVHHKSGVEWDNRAENLEVLGHAEHSEVTQAEQRAWAEDAKRDLQQELTQSDAALCKRCSKEADASVAGESYCLEHAKTVAVEEGERIEMV